MRTACVIPARSGSVRIPGKNMRDFRGKPIIQYSIDTAKASGLFDDIIVSTDDDFWAMKLVQPGVRIFDRPPDDGSRGTQDVAADVLRVPSFYAGLACVLYATAPLLTPQHLIDGWKHLMAHKNLRYAYSVDPDGKDIGGYYWGLGHCIVAGPTFVHEAPYVGKVWTDSRYCCDINTPEDWSRAESMFDALRRADGNG